MSDVRSFKDLIAWQRAIRLGVVLYRTSSEFPDAERFGLTSQLRRAGVSVASNIAEGYGHGSTSDYIRFLKIARGSLCEIETQLILAEQLEMGSTAALNTAQDAMLECRKVLAGLIARLETRGDQL